MNKTICCHSSWVLTSYLSLDGQIGLYSMRFANKPYNSVFNISKAFSNFIYDERRHPVYLLCGLHTFEHSIIYCTYVIINIIPKLMTPKINSVIYVPIWGARTRSSSTQDKMPNFPPSSFKQSHTFKMLKKLKF